MNQPVKVEIVQGHTASTVTVEAVEEGDVVDVPVWFDVRYLPAKFKMAPFVAFSFDRLIILEKHK